jgi:hypothetical protein
MKKLLILILACFSLMALKSDNPSDYMRFDKTTHDFGNIVQGIPVTAKFVITNISSEAIIINSIERQCGCTTPKFNTTPIGKSESDTITVGYNAAVIGAFTKKITVKTNFGNTELFIRGTVIQ